jgi:hypothetical protein
VGRTITPGDGTVAEQLRDKICASFAERLEVFFTEGARIREVCEGFRGGGGRREVSASLCGKRVGFAAPSGSERDREGEGQTVKQT